MDDLGAPTPPPLTSPAAGAGGQSRRAGGRAGTTDAALPAESLSDELLDWRLVFVFCFVVVLGFYFLFF